MLMTKPVGRQAPTLKYDILTALAAYALAGDKHLKRSVLRMMALITARYNWQGNELSIGQREIARLWSVDPRTVKREMARFRVSGWIRIKRAGARGRVTLYALELEKMLFDTRGQWHAVGPDFVARLHPAAVSAQQGGAKVVPFRQPAFTAQSETDGIWTRAQHALHMRDPEQYLAWFALLEEENAQGGVLSLRAPNGFMADYIATHLAGRLLAAASEIDPAIRDIRLVVN